MNLRFIPEPFLEFGRGIDICPRSGIATYDVYDTKMNARRNRILVGGVGTSANLEALAIWLEKCSKPIASNPERQQPNLFPSFCGFNKDYGFKAEIVFEEEISRELYNSNIRKILRMDNRSKKIEEAVDFFYRHVKFLAQNRVVDVIVCVIPDELYDEVSITKPAPVEEVIEEEPDDIYETNFRRALKAKTMHLGKPLQLVREATLKSESKTQQDDATKAWNFSTALYYKANKTVPWRLITNVNKPSVCFVGIGFYKSRDRKILHTSLAQIFDELGNNVILRGTPVEIDKEDRRPQLTKQQAYDLLRQALIEYEAALSTTPARLVIHKSSNFRTGEIEGFREASDELRVNALDFVTIMDTDLRLLRGTGRIYPPYRGSHVELNSSTHLLYTRGSVGYYKTYPGKYIPQPLEVRIVESDESPSVICQEILSLTKMNWNNTQFDGKYPITIQCARKVGEIMKYLKENDNPQISYSFYM